MTISGVILSNPEKLTCPHPGQAAPRLVLWAEPHPLLMTCCPPCLVDARVNLEIALVWAGWGFGLVDAIEYGMVTTLPAHWVEADLPWLQVDKSEIVRLS